MAEEHRTKKKARRRNGGGLSLLRMLLLVAVVLVVFEGRLVEIMFRQASSSSTQASSSPQAGNTVSGQTVSSDSTGSDSSGANSTSSDSAGSSSADSSGTANSASGSSSSGSSSETGSSSVSSTLVGLSAGQSATGTTTSSGSDSASGSSGTEETSASTAVVSDAVVPAQDTPVDDSYFSDAVFIGDSRMEGFRNTSGITQGTFLTSVGMTLTSISSETVNSSEGTITVYQGLSGRQYRKIYLMLGTNDLGYYPMDQFQGLAEGVLAQMHQLQPNALIYVISVLYVEPSKVTTSYVNNDNVRTVNGYLLGACEDLDYCYYLNLNEIFDNGYGSMLEGATADGVHLQSAYSKMMLDYLKSHYISTDQETASP